MKRIFFTFLGVCLVSIQSGFTQVPETTSLQGVLVDQAGSLFSDGNYELTFRIYDVPTGGSALWQEQQTVATESGIFNVILGSITPLDHTFDRAYWIGIAIGSDTELSPRLQLTASPYSLIAKTVPDSTITGEKIAVGTTVRSLNGKTDAI